MLRVFHASQTILQQPWCPNLWTSQRQSGYKRGLLITACGAGRHSSNTCTSRVKGDRAIKARERDSHQTLRQQNCCNELSLLKGVTINKPKSGNCNSLWGKEAEGWSWELQTGKAHFSSRRMVEIPINNRIIKHIKERVTIEIKWHSSCEGKLCFFNLKKCFGWLSNSG